MRTGSGIRFQGCSAFGDSAFHDKGVRIHFSTIITVNLKTLNPKRC